MFNGQPGRGLLGIPVGLADEFPSFRGNIGGGSGFPATGLLGLGLPSSPAGNYPVWRNEGANPSMDNSRLLALMFPPLPAGGPLPYRSDNDYLQQVRDPLKCSGPNSTCELPVMCGCPRRCKRSFERCRQAMIGCCHVSGLEVRLCHMPRAGMEIRRPGANQKSER